MTSADDAGRSKLLDAAAIVYDLRPFIGQQQSIEMARAAIRTLRDPPHTLLDKARGTRLASGDALVFWNAMIDEITNGKDT